MSSAGQQLIAGRIPGERIATTEAIEDSATFTGTVVELMSVTAPLVISRIYRVYAYVGLMSTVADDTLRARIIEDSIAGNNLDQSRVQISGASSTSKHTVICQSEYQATATGNKTFVVGGDQIAGGGVGRMEASPNRKSYLYVDYIRG